MSLLMTSSITFDGAPQMIAQSPGPRSKTLLSYPAYMVGALSTGSHIWRSQRYTSHSMLYQILLCLAALLYSEDDLARGDMRPEAFLTDRSEYGMDSVLSTTKVYNLRVYCNDRLPADSCYDVFEQHCLRTCPTFGNIVSNHACRLVLRMIIIAQMRPAG